MQRLPVQALAFVWRILPDWFRRRLLWLLNPKIVVGVSGVLLNEENAVLLLKHRFHPHWPWGLPGGWVGRGEPLAAAWRREVCEETGYDVRVEALVAQRSTRLSLEFVFMGRITAGEMTLDSFEILDGRFFPPDQLPAGLHDDHRRAIERVFRQPADLAPVPRGDEEPPHHDMLL